MAEIVPLLKPPSRAKAQEIVRALANDGKVRFSKHCKLRKKQRTFTTVQIINCLKKGFLIEDPHQSLEYKGWMTAVSGTVAGKQIKVVLVLRWEQDLLTVTVYDN